MAARRPRDYRDRTMGIETILVVGIVVIIVALAVGLGRARRKARRATESNPSDPKHTAA
jgi:hypothetical protein